MQWIASESHIELPGQLGMKYAEQAFFFPFFSPLYDISLGMFLYLSYASYPCVIEVWSSWPVTTTHVQLLDSYACRVTRKMQLLSYLSLLACAISRLGFWLRAATGPQSKCYFNTRCWAVLFP